MTTDVETAEIPKSFSWGKFVALITGVLLFVVVYYCPPWPDAVDPTGKHFVLSQAGKGAIAVFLMAGTWWVFEVVPIGVTSLAIGVLQAMFLIRPARDAFTDFMVPSVMFIFASIMIGLVFTKTGLTKRLAYKMLIIVGEKTSMIYLGCFIVTAALAHIMAHTAVAATIYPLLMTIYALYTDEEKPTKFGKGLFIGMAFVAGAGSIVTLLGAARGAVALAETIRRAFRDRRDRRLAPRVRAHEPTMPERLHRADRQGTPDGVCRRSPAPARRPRRPSSSEVSARAPSQRAAATRPKQPRCAAVHVAMRCRPGSEFPIPTTIGRPDGQAHFDPAPDGRPWVPSCPRLIVHSARSIPKP